MTSPSGVKRPLKVSSGNPQAQNAPAKRVRHKSSSKTSTAVWDVTGRYTLCCANKYQPVDANDYVLDMRYTHTSSHTCQLYAFFNFPNLNLTGRMRLCPKNAIASSSNGKLFLSNFEAACELAEDVRPGPKSKEWLMRWRGEEDGFRLGGETRAQGQFLFEEENGPKIRIKFAMVHKGKHLILEGTQQDTSPESDEDKVAAEDPTAQTDASRMLEDWKQLYEPLWEQKSPSDTEEDERELLALQDAGAPLPKPHNKWENPRTGRVISTKNKPGPIPGFIVNAAATSRYLEELPDWAWNVMGKYEISTIGLTKALGVSEGKPLAMTMTVQMDNNAKHQKAGRQLWATIEVGDSLALARFRPSPTPNGLLEDSLEVFEKACVLKPGVWVGPKPQGTQNWEMRWRGFSDASLQTMAEDAIGSEVIFTKDDQGKLIFRGKMIVKDESFLVVGTCVAPTEERRPSAPTVNTEWAKYLKGKPAIKIRRHPEHIIVLDKYCQSTLI
ncbi:hypothetical protein F4813DRAFT_385490 [Daldinia decipiens]|uniref:uncharacterized protein n=1 Tax=Daldinia decipiens TaxID=326647 RepID=UPI0020C445CE|nr:uncharacterized protein F4813DRAFT_385490 [Daldinia decipiens]KAI1661819.1 hypothetical protein F4813DRAFT_385490 [Daldinia decipiens]